MSSEDLQPEEAEIGEIFARLRREVRGGETAPSGDGGGGPIRLRARSEAERYWSVRGDRAFTSRPGTFGRLRGVVLSPLKVLLRRLMRWYVEPIASDQRSFNRSVLRLVDELTERTSAEVARLQEAVDRLEAGEKRETAPGE